MNEKQLFSEIRRLAHSLKKNNDTYTRADLAYELKKFGFMQDTFEISRLVWDAYNHYQQDKDIKDAFTGNDGYESLVEEFRITALVEGNTSNALFKVLNQRLYQTGCSLEETKDYAEQTLKGEVIKVSAGLLSHITGTSGVNSVKKEAASIFDGYSVMVDAYENARVQVQSRINDFVSLRAEVNRIYIQYSMALIDTFGDSIRQVAPEMFDFNAIKYLNVSGMLKNVRLEYDQLQQTCAALIGEISDNFRQALQSSTSQYRAAGGKGVGLMLAGVEMLSHYMSAGERTTAARQQLRSLKNNVIRDAATIKGDLARLFIIYKNLNDIFIPTAQAFYTKSGVVLTRELKALHDSLYAAPEIKLLQMQREELLQAMKDLEAAIADAEINIAYYRQNIASVTEQLKSEQSNYDQALTAKPSRPLLNFGPMARNYNRRIYEWDAVYTPVIRNYENLEVDLNLDKEELQNYLTGLERDKRQYEDIRQKFTEISRKIVNVIKVNPQVKAAMASHLKDLVDLLRTARYVVSQKPDDKNLVPTFKLEAPQSVTLPAAYAERINTFMDSLRHVVSFDENLAAKSVSYLNREMGYKDETLTPGQALEVAQAQARAVQQGISLLQSWTKLKADEAQDEVTEAGYRHQLARLQADFKQQLQAIDNKAAVLKGILAQINTASDDETLKEGLKLLSGIKGTTLTDRDIDAFLEGRQQIEL